MRFVHSSDVHRRTMRYADADVRQTNKDAASILEANRLYRDLALVVIHRFSVASMVLMTSSTRSVVTIGGTFRISTCSAMGTVRSLPVWRNSRMLCGSKIARR
jgi:uncharacterized protein YejL (UPF0352 family)